MFHEKSSQLQRVLILADAAGMMVALVLAFHLHAALQGRGEADFFSHLALVPLFFAFVFYFLLYFGGYASPRGSTRFSYSWAVARSVLVGSILLITLLFVLKIQYVSRAILLPFAGITALLLIVNRLGALHYQRRSFQGGSGTLKILIIGTGSRAVRLARKLRLKAEWGLQVVGHLDPDPEMTGRLVEGAEVLGDVRDISAVLKGHVVDEVLLAIPRAMIPDVDAIAQACEEEGVKLRFMADVFDVHVARMRLVQLDDIPLLTLEPVVQDEGKMMVKRSLDLMVTLLALPFLLPLFAVVAVAIKLDSRGPVFFVQERVGRSKRLFPFYKFRTMVLDAEARMKELEHLNEADGAIFKIKDDPRITRVGKFLRRTSLDELPQFFNVLRGDMSLVGPRPMSIRDVDLFDQGMQRKRFSVKPGLACLREVSGRSALTFSQWIESDLEYIENWSLGLDVKILLKLVPAVLRGAGAV